jgi:hypothetical protein
MAKVIDIKPIIKTLPYSESNQDFVREHLKNFPKCGVRYGSFGNGDAFMLISQYLVASRENMKMLDEKIKAASIRGFNTVTKIYIPRGEELAARAAGL